MDGGRTRAAASVKIWTADRKREFFFSGHAGSPGSVLEFTSTSVWSSVGAALGLAFRRAAVARRGMPIPQGQPTALIVPREGLVCDPAHIF